MAGPIPPTVLALCTVFPALAIFSVLARFRARALRKAKLMADDWLIIPALVAALGNCAAILYGAIQCNLGQHMPTDPEGFAELGPKLIALEKMGYITELLSPLAVTLARHSILLFYSRIFATPTRTFKAMLYIAYFLNLGWGIAFFFVYMFQCTPIDAVWNSVQGKRAHCVNDVVNDYYAVISIIVDVVVLAIPWPVVWKLKMPVRQKVAVSGIFLLGGIVTAVSIGKCYTFFTISALIQKNHDLTYDEAPIYYWIVPETCLFIVCACLPTLRPIFHNFSPESILGSIRSALSLRSAASSVAGSKTYATAFDGDSKGNTESRVSLRKVSTEPRVTEEPMELGELEKGGIRVTRDFEARVGRS